MRKSNLTRTVGRGVVCASLVGVLAAVFARDASAQLQNGNFAQWTTAPNPNNNTSGSFTELGISGGSPAVTPTLQNWAVPGTGIACVAQTNNIIAFSQGNNSSTAICGESYGGPTTNPNGGPAISPSWATLWASPGPVPVAGYTGNIIVADSDQGSSGTNYTENISQTIAGLKSGVKYELSFYQAGVQQTGFTGAFTDWWKVTINGQTFNSNQMAVASEGMVGWQQQIFTFTAGATNVLTFLAQSNDSGSNEPPMVLLASVTLPEPTTWAILGLGMAALTVVHRRRRRA